MTTHIVTLGGGGFSMSRDGSPTNLDRYLVELTGRRAPMVCFAPTASADDASYIRRFLTAYGSLGVRTMVLTLWTDAAASVARLPEADLVLVGAGGFSYEEAARLCGCSVGTLKARVSRARKHLAEKLQ